MRFRLTPISMILDDLELVFISLNFQKIVSDNVVRSSNLSNVCMLTHLS